VSSGAAGIVIALLVLFACVAFVSRQSSMDIGGPLREWFNRRDAQKVARRQPRPPEVRRRYWSLGEYQRDARRYAALGYVTASEDITEPYVTDPIVARLYDERPSMFRQGPPPRHRVPVARVVYRLR